MLNEPGSHFVEASFLFFQKKKKIRLCAYNLIGPGSDRCVYNQVESRVTRRNRTGVVFLFTRAFFS